VAACVHRRCVSLFSEPLDRRRERVPPQHLEPVPGGDERHLDVGRRQALLHHLLEHRERKGLGLAEGHRPAAQQSGGTSWGRQLGAVARGRRQLLAVAEGGSGKRWQVVVGSGRRWQAGSWGSGRRWQ
jgi:hypothetical protein